MKLLKWLVILLNSVILLSCSNVIPNEEICISLPSGKAFCKYTLQDIERTIPALEWTEMSIGRFSMTPESFGEYQKFIEKACIRAKCTEAEKREMRELISKLKSMMIE